MKRRSDEIDLTEEVIVVKCVGRHLIPHRPVGI